MGSNSVDVNTLVEAVAEDPRLKPIEKETHIGFTKDGSFDNRRESIRPARRPSQGVDVDSSASHERYGVVSRAEPYSEQFAARTESSTTSNTFGGESLRDGATAVV
jgi:hypothetical protein